MVKRSVAVVVVSAFLGLACGGLADPEPEVVEAEPAPAVVEPEAEPEPPPHADLPAGKFGSLPGWLGWATMADRGKSAFQWTVPAEGSQVVIFDGEDWSAAPSGRAVRGLTREGNLPLTFAGVTTLKVGCDGGTPNQVATFKAELPELPEQAVWILPDGTTAAALPLAQTETEKKKASWTLGPLLIHVRAEADGKGRLEVFRDSETLLDRGWEIHPGPDDSELNFTDGMGVPGVPAPLAGFRIDEHTSVVVFQIYSMEGVHWEVFGLRDGGMTLAGDAYLYLCAF